MSSILRERNFFASLYLLEKTKYTVFVQLTFIFHILQYTPSVSRSSWSLRLLIVVELLVCHRTRSSAKSAFSVFKTSAISLRKARNRVQLREDPYGSPSSSTAFEDSVSSCISKNNFPRIRFSCSKFFPGFMYVLNS